MRARLLERCRVACAAALLATAACSDVGDSSAIPSGPQNSDFDATSPPGASQGADSSAGSDQAIGASSDASDAGVNAGEDGTGAQSPDAPPMYEDSAVPVDSSQPDEGSGVDAAAADARAEDARGVEAGVEA
ncbi:MAG TPA: hypothetical protein VE987_20215, partial [Polyangiaceae bacterium]|nr:hypothetical protein [Polyangiaceae bacterium]